MNVIFLTNSLLQSSLPIPDESVPITILNTPAGIPALSAKYPRASAERGVRVGGLKTTEQPTAIAGATFLVIMAFGKFHGVIAPTTPTGCFITTIRLSS